MRFIVVNIGCIECGVTSDIVGVFSDRVEATRVAEDCKSRFAWRENGQNDFRVFEIPAGIGIRDCYADKTKKWHGGSV